MSFGVSYTSKEKAIAQAIVDEMIARGVGAGGGSGGGSGDASAYNQTLEIVRLEAIRDKLPSALVNNRLVVDNSGVTQPVSGSVSVANLPATQLVAWTTPQPISGNVNVGNFPATQPISATTLPLPDGAATDAVISSIRDRLPPTLAAGRLVVDGSAVTQPISGAVSVNNLPSTQQVFWTTPQQIAGNVSVTNFPTTQPISGDVSVTNFPANQPISATTLPLPTGAASETTLALLPLRLGNTTDATATTDTGAFSLMALVKRLLASKLPSALSSDRFKVESQLTSTARTTSFINTTASGTIAAGASSIAIANVGSASGTVKGVSIPVGATINFAANGNDTLDALNYSATGTNFLITTII